MSVSLQALIIFFSLIVTQFEFSVASEQSIEDAFTNIYKNKKWGCNEFGEGSSGPGSTLEMTEPYRFLLQDFLNSSNIQSVVDVGCGDWEFSRAINWTGIDYRGYDVVKSVIQHNQERYSAANIQFFLENALTFELPSADLLICKDVLQHLPNEDIHNFIQQLHKYKYCLLTNDIFPPYTNLDRQLNRGGFGKLDLTQPPFSLNGIYVLSFCHGIKKVLFIDNSQSGF
jgi:SAM-dependent methyltransferase